MKRARAGGVLAGAVLLAAAFGPTAAWAAAPTKAGWWNAASAGGTALPMPTTATGDLHVGQGPNGPTAYAAVGYDLSGQQVSGAVLELKITPNSTVGTPDLTACPTKTTSWRPVDDGPIADAPTYDCSTHGVAGLVSATGDTVTFLLDQAQQLAGGYSLAIVPSANATPFQLDLTKPGAQSLTVTAFGDATQPAAPPTTDAGGYVPPPVTTGGGSSSGMTPSNLNTAVLSPTGTTALSAPAPALAGAATTGGSAPAPVVAPPGGLAAVPAASALLPPASNRARYVAGSLLALIVGALVWAVQQQSPQPRLIGGLARTAPAAPLDPAAPTRGIGRFASARTAPPRRLI